MSLDIDNLRKKLAEIKVENEKKWNEAKVAKHFSDWRKYNHMLNKYYDYIKLERVKKTFEIINALLITNEVDRYIDKVNKLYLKDNYNLISLIFDAFYTYGEHIKDTNLYKIDDLYMGSIYGHYLLYKSELLE